MLGFGTGQKPSCIVQGASLEPIEDSGEDPDDIADEELEAEYRELGLSLEEDGPEESANIKPAYKLDVLEKEPQLNGGSSSSSTGNDAGGGGSYNIEVDIDAPYGRHIDGTPIRRYDGSTRPVDIPGYAWQLLGEKAKVKCIAKY